MHRLRCCFLLLSIALSAPLAPAGAEIIEVADPPALKQALASVQPDTTLRVAPGEYPGGLSVADVPNLTVEAADPEQPPVFVGGNMAWQFSRCPGLKLRHLHARGQKHNGFNLDDGGRRDRPVKDVTLEHLAVSDVGPKGNCDAIKCSGLDDLAIRHCTIAGWGGQAIDLVGCHRVVITGCTFTGKAGFSQATGPQFKGGSSEVLIEKCRFQHAGERPVNAGGSTGFDYFRPPGAKYEARRITIRGNHFTGSPCACAFVGVDGAVFTGNTVLFPEKWFFRILQETVAEGFPPCRNVRIEDNTVVFRRAQVASEINIGPHTAPETFRFARNRWFAEDCPGESTPDLPTPEQDGQYGKDPRIEE